MTTEPKSFTLTVRREVTPRQVVDTLISAFEGGVGYWCQIDNEKGPSYNEAQLFRVVDGDSFLLLIDQEERRAHKLTRAKIAEGLRLMAENHPDDFRDMTSEDTGADAGTGDIFLQLCLLGEVSYG
jgi:hypothetical protein